jgi:ABC-type transporter Mla subunit MlaD
MTERANYAKLGLFVIVGVAMLLFGVTMLGAGAFKSKGFKCETYFKESVDGLDVGAPVKLKGVTVGKVTRISFVSSKYDIAGDRSREQQMLSGSVLVEMEFDPMAGIQKDWKEKFKRTIERGLRAQLTTAGLMGSAYVEISFADPARNPPMALEWEPELPYVPSMPSTMGQIKAAAEKIAQQLQDAHIDEVVHNVDKLIKDLNEKVLDIDMKGIQGEVLALAKDLRETNARIKQVLDKPEVDAAVADAAKTAASVRSASGQIDTMLGDAQTKKMLADVGNTAAAASPAAADLRRLLRRLDAMMAGHQEDVGATLTGLRRTSENVEQLTGDAKQNPARLLFGDPPPKSKVQVDGDHK